MKIIFNSRRSTLLRGIDCGSTRATSGENKYMKRHGIYSFQLKFNWSTRRWCQIPGKTYYTWLTECVCVCMCVSAVYEIVSADAAACLVAAQRWWQSKPKLILIRSKMLALHFWFLFLPFSLFVSLCLYLSSFMFHLCIWVCCVLLCVCVRVYHKAHL